MPIRDATKDEIRAMMARLQEKREQRQLEADINEVIDMVQHRGPSQSAREGCQLPQGGSQGRLTCFPFTIHFLKTCAEVA